MLPTVIDASQLHFSRRCKHRLYQDNSNIAFMLSSLLYTSIHWIRYKKYDLPFSIIHSIIYDLVYLPFDLLYPTPNAETSEITLKTMMIIGPAIEELIFRKFLQSILLKKISNKILHKFNIAHLNHLAMFMSVVFSSMIFSAVHYNGQPSDLRRFMMGLYYGFLYEKTNNLYVGIAAHALVNFFLFIKTYINLINDKNYQPSYFLDTKQLLQKQQQFFDDLITPLFLLSFFLIARVALSFFQQGSEKKI